MRGRCCQRAHTSWCASAASLAGLGLAAQRCQAALHHLPACMPTLAGGRCLVEATYAGGRLSAPGATPGVAGRIKQLLYT